MQSANASVVQTIVHQTRVARKMIRGLVEPLKAQADIVPAGWNNNLRWHVGHLVITPRLLTFGLAKEPIGVPEEYRAWFAKGTGPSAWKSGDAVPGIDQLLDEMDSTIDAIVNAFNGREEAPFPEPYVTSVGITLASPADSLPFNQMHDGMHLGMMMALRRALK